MNYLAHFYLSGPEPGVICGNFIGDAVKGKDYDHYPDDIRHGILLHRFIDSTTDSHPINRESRALLRPYTGKYSAVALDMVYDHYLARHWHNYSGFSLESFFNRCLATLDNYHEWLPPVPLSLLEALQRHNWMVNYGSLEGLEGSLIGLSKRVRRGEKLPLAVEAVKRFDDQLEENFTRFFGHITGRVREEYGIAEFRPPEM